MTRTVVWHRQKGHTQPNEFMDMFDEHALWLQAASQVKVFLVEPDFIIYGKEDMVSRMVAGLTWEPQTDHVMPDSQPGILARGPYPDFPGQNMRTLFSKTILQALMVVALPFGNQGANAADNDFNVWLSGVDPVVLHDRDKNATDNDFMALFKSGSSWARASARTQVFKVSTQFLHRSSDEQLATVVQYLRSHHIALALEAEIMVTSVRCGNGIPGFTTTNVIHKAIEQEHLRISS